MGPLTSIRRLIIFPRKVVKAAKEREEQTRDSVFPSTHSSHQPIRVTS